MDDSINNADVFIYTEGAEVPRDVVRVRVHPSVTVIPEMAFRYQKRLEEVELCEGLVEIGKQAFMQCILLKNIIIPSTVTSIGMQAFASVQSNILLPDGIESIGTYAFACNSHITNFKVPTVIMPIPSGMFSACIGMFSVEISENLTQIVQSAFPFCSSLRNVALSSDAEVVASGQFDRYYDKCRDLHKLFGTTEQLINALKHRFDNLPIHKMIYYQSYNNVTVDQLNNATDIRISRRRSKLNPSGSQQDCMGMTPLHIMACSTVQNIELYKVLVDKNPETLVTEDRWGASPLFYSIWGDAPGEIIEFLVERYKSVYPDYVMNWTSMLTTLGIAGVPVEVIQNLLDLQEESFHDQSIDWDAVIERLPVEPNSRTYGYYFSRREAFQLLVKCSFTERINAIGLKRWRDNVIDTVMNPGFKIMDVKEDTWLNGIKSKLSQYEDEYSNLKEATSLLELALWEMELNDQSKKGRQNKKMKIDRKQYRVSCGAEIVIQHVLPYLLADEIETIDDSSESEISDNEFDY